MKAAVMHEFGGPEVLTYEELADPQPREGAVLVGVRACALNHLDLWVRKGLPGGESAAHPGKRHFGRDC